MGAEYRKTVMNDDFARILTLWFHRNMRDLPWRKKNDPYFVWLSEIILQQTRVAQGLAYYQRFAESFPDVFSLANASEEKILKLWQGLGYYSRARNMHHTAKVVANEMHGTFPQTASELTKLKGIGPYTGAAIASICFDEQIAVVDGNVNRLISRYFGILEAVDSPVGKKKINDLANKLVPKSKPGDFNQAMMEFGALQCTPQNPACSTCPLSGGCYALQHKAISVLPNKVPKKAAKKLFLYFFRIQSGIFTFLNKREGKGIWQNLFEYPSVESFIGLQVPELIEKLTEMGCSIKDLEPDLRVYQHILTHRIIEAQVLNVTLNKNSIVPANWTKTSKMELHTFPVSRLMEKVLGDE